MTDLIPADRIPVELQPLAILILTWGVSLYALVRVPPSTHRRLVTSLATIAFSSYWLLFAAGVNLWGLGPYFGPDGLGYEVLFATLVLAVHHSFRTVENRLYRRPTQAVYPEITFLGAESPTIVPPSGGDTSLRAEPKTPTSCVMRLD